MIINYIYPLSTVIPGENILRIMGDMGPVFTSTVETYPLLRISTAPSDRDSRYGLIAGLSTTGE
jgi:hypothetical protein